MLTVLEEINKLTEAYQASKKTLVDMIKPQFFGLFTVIFAAHPTLTSFGWTQYTPSYCDGDPCHFSVNNDSESIMFTTDEGDNTLYAYELDADDPLSQAAEDLSQILQQIPDEIYLDLYGDDAEVTVHRDGRVVTSECSHD